MKHSLLLLRMAALGLLAIQFTSCQKILDHWPGHGHSGGGDSTVKYRIRSMQYSYSYDTTASRVATFHYSADNLLDSITSPGQGNTFSDELIRFVYNENGALIEYLKIVRPSHATGIIIDRKYGIGDQNRIVADTFEAYEVAPGYSDRSQIEYDDNGRIFREFHEYEVQSGSDGPPVFFDTATFQYDGNGNRGVVVRDFAQSGGGVTDSTVYDNKVAYRSTNPIFQFYDRDYSKNNSNYATGYNAAGLPLGFAVGSMEHFLDIGEPRVIEWEEVP